jgi:hypothetical protein
MEKVKYNSKSQSGYFNDDTLEHFAHVARTEGWNVMTRDVWEFVKNDCEWNTDDERWHLSRVLLHEVGYELTRFTRMD